MGVSTCLMEYLQNSHVYTAAVTTPATCAELQVMAFNSHPKCYVDHGFFSTFATSISNLYGLYSAMDIVDDFILSEVSGLAWSQVFQTIYLSIVS